MDQNSNRKPAIDVNLFKPHSTRAAATSKAFLKSVPLIEHILSDVGWSSSDTFAKFYKPVINTDSFLLFCYKSKATKLLWLRNMFFGVY